VVLYVATCLTRWVDDEMQERIERHREDRPAEWRTEEDELDVLGLIGVVEEPVILVDCMTLWLSGRMAEGADEALLLSEARALNDTALQFGKVVVLVSNELGYGPVPEHPETRKFRDTAGRLNQTLAANAMRVDWVVAGIPITIKPKLKISPL
jgi:adenosylcobinamide kinase/adenosylcobinamide-phosphate guanylyltransferase